jgi:hypothetical protein
MPSLGRCKSLAEDPEDAMHINTFIGRCPQLDSLATQCVELDDFRRIIFATRPRFAAFGHEKQALTGLQVKQLLRTLLTGSGSTNQIREFFIFDAGITTSPGVLLL